MNAEIEHASPHGKNPGEKVPGQRKMIGLRAKRAWEKRGQHPPPGPGAPSDRRPGRPVPVLPKASFTAYAVLGYGLFKQLRKKDTAGV